MTGAIVGFNYAAAAERLEGLDADKRARVIDLLTGIEAATLAGVRDAAPQDAGE